jgi:tetratricopeptide (TPR) repeat protein
LYEPSKTVLSSVGDALENARKLLPTHPLAAAEQAREIIRVEPDIAEAYVLLACSLRSVRDDAEALRNEQIAIAVAEKSPVIVRVRKQIADGDLSKADELLQLYLADTPNDPVAIYLRSHVRKRLSDFSEAQRLLERAIALAPSFQDARVALDAPSTTAIGALQQGSADDILDDGSWFTGEPEKSGEKSPAT